MGFFSKDSKKNKKLNNIDSDDELDFDFDDDFGSIGGPDTKSRKPVERVASGIKESVKRNATSFSTYKNLALNALPKEYTDIDRVVTDTYDKLSNSYNEEISSLKPEISKLSSKVDKLIPENQRFLRKLYDKTLRKFKEEESSGSNVDIQQEQINKTLNDIFTKQREVDLAKEAKDQARNTIKEKIENNRFLTSFNTLNSIDGNLSALRNYQDTITQAYQKKTIELQYRSYFVQAEMLKSMKEHFHETRNENKSIVYNTALPDFVKISKSEKVKDVFSTKFGEKIYGSLFGSDMVSNITKALTDKLRSTVDSIKLGLSSIDMMSGFDPAEMAGEFVGDQISTSVRDYGSKKLKGLIDKNPELAKKIAVTGKKGANILIHNPEAHIQALANKYLTPDLIKDSDTMIFLKEFFSDIISSSRTTIDKTLESEKGIDALYKPSIFTDKAHTSITEVIPGYLSRILREMTILRTGNDKSPVQIFDFKSNKFTTTAALTKSYKDKLLSDISKQRATSDISDITEKIAGRSSDKSKQEINKFISGITTKTMVYDSTNIKNSSEYKSLSSNVKKTVDRYLTKLDQDELNKADFETKLSEIKNTYTDPRRDLETGIRYGHGDILENLGIIEKNEESLYSFNMNKYKDLIDKGVSDTDTDESDRASSSINKGSTILGKVGSKISGIIDLTKDTIAKLSSSISNSIMSVFKSLFDKKDTSDNNLSVDDSFSKSITDNLDNNFGLLLSKMDILIDKIGDIKAFNMSIPTIDFSKLKGKARKLYASLSKLEMPDHIRQYYLDAFKSGRMTIEEIKTEISDKYKKVRSSLSDITIGNMAGRVMSGVKWGVGKAIDYTRTSAKGLYSASKWLGKKGLAAAKVAKDPAIEAVSTIFTTLVNFSKKTLEIGKDLIFDKLPKGLTSGFKILKSLSSNINKLYMSSDVYVKGETEPRLQARLLRNGYYRLRDTGKPIYNFKEITGVIIDDSGNVILSSEDINKGLVDKDGKPLATPFEKLVGFGVKTLKAGVGRAKEAISGLVGLFSGKLPNIMLTSQTRLDKIVDILTQIRDIISYKFNINPGDVSSVESTESEDEESSEEDMGGKSTKSGKSKKARTKSKKSKLLNNTKKFLKKGFGKTYSKIKGSDKFNDVKDKASKSLGKVKGSKAYAATKGILKGGFGLAKGIISSAFGTLTNMKGGDESDESSKSKYTESSATSATSGIMNEHRNSYKARLAKMDEERKDKHKFKEGNVKARYTGESILNKVGGMFDLVKGLLTVSGLSTLLSGVMSKIPFIGKFFDSDKKAKGGKPKAGKVKGGGPKVGGKTKLLSGKAGKLLKGGAWAMGASVAADALGAPEWVGDTIGGLMMASTVAGLFGTSLLGIGTAVTTGAAAILTGVAALISSPVAAAVLAVGATAYIGYKIYKRLTENDLDDYQKIRYQQYGINLKDETHISKLHYIKDLEEYIINEGIVVKDGEVSLGQNIDTKKFFNLVDIDPEKDKGKAERFMGWFINRCKPFLLKHSLALSKANKKHNLNGLDKLNNIEKLTYLSGLVDDLDGPYGYSTSPFVDMNDLVNNKDVVGTYVRKLLTDIKDKSKSDNDKTKAETLKKQLDDKAKNDAKLYSQESQTIDNKLEKEKAEAAKKSQSASNAISADMNKSKNTINPSTSSALKNLPVATQHTTELSQGDGTNNDSSVGGKKSALVNELRIASGPLRDGSNAMNYITIANKNIDLDSIDDTLKRNLLGMIEEYGEITGKKVIVTDGFRTRAQQQALRNKLGDKAAPPGSSLHEFGIAVDIDSGNANEMDNLGLMRKYGFIRPVGKEPWHIEPIGIQSNIGKAKQDINFRTMQIESSLYKGGLGYGTVSDANKYKRSNKTSMDILNSSNAIIVDPSETWKSLQGGKAGDSIASSAPGKGKEEVNTIATISKNKESGTWDVLKKPGSGPIYSDTTGTPPNTDVKAAITTAANKTGVDEAKMMTIAAVESDFNPMAKAGSSSAKGLYQFTNSTWSEFTKKAGYARSADIMDPNIHSVVAGTYIKENENRLAKSGVNPGIFESYLSHFLGYGGAIKLLKADPNAIAAEILPSAANSNKNIFYQNNKPLTVAEVKDVIRNKLATKAKAYGINTDELDQVSQGSSIATTSDAATANPTNAKTEIPATKPALYNKPSSVIADIPVISPVRSSSSTGVVDNYSKLISDTINTSIEYQKAMVNHLSSIDTNLVNALEKVIANISSSNKNMESYNRNAGTNYKEQLNPSVDLRRKQAI